jgi:hypothetical protein
MFRKLRPRSIYDVFALLALIVAVGGTSAYAANTVFSTDIVDGEVKSVDVGDAEVKSADVKDQSLTTFDVSTFLGADVVDNTLTGADVDEATLNLVAEPWHEIGAPGEPTFNDGLPNHDFCYWTNFDGAHNSAAFLRDRAGFVHLKGLVDANDGDMFQCGVAGDYARIFSLPEGYRPAQREVHLTLTNGALGRVNVDVFLGTVTVEAPTTFANAEQWLSLDGISFRCAPSGQNGCP